MIKKFFILLLATVASVGMSFAQDPGIVSSGTKGGMSYTFYDNGLLEISGSGALPESAFTNWDGGFGTSVKNIRFAEDCEVYGLDYLWFACYTENSQLETVEINSVAPIMFSGTSGAGIFYRQDGAVTLTITAPGIVDVESGIIGNYGSPVNMIFNMPATTVFERKWFSGLENNFAVTIPTGAKGHIPAGYVFKDSYDQEEYDHLVADGYEDMFWDTHSYLTEGVDYTLGVESTFVITAENASQIFGQAAVSFQAPTEASNSKWVFWRKSDLKEFPDMSSGDQKVYKDVTVKVNNGVYNTNSGWGLHFKSLAEDGVQFVAPEGKEFKRIVILNEYGTFSDPNWSYDSNYKKWSGSADTVGFVGDICGISLIEFELGDSAPAAPAYETVMNLINAIGTVELTAECKAKIDAARTAYNALSDDDKAQVANYETLTQAEATFNQAEADKVIAKIAAIPTPVELKLATRDSIQNARAAYDALTADQQALVSNYTDLTDAEAALAALNPGTAPSTPLDSAQVVKNLIEAIPTPVEYPASGAAIEAALNAYNELSDAAKGALDDADVQKLNDAAAQYAALEAIAAIDNIPEITYDPAVKAAIETAREKYDALSDASKALVSADEVEKLTNAEQVWATLAAKVEHNVTYFGKESDELKVEKVALLRIPDPAPDLNGFEFVRWDVKAGDLLEDGLHIKAVYDPIITTNPVAYDTLAYNGTAQTLVTAGAAKEGHIEYSLNSKDNWSTELPTATIASTNVVYYKLVREGHEDYLADSIVSIIAKAPVTYTEPQAYDTLVYNAANQTLIIAGQTNDGTFEYSLNPTQLDSWKTELPKAMDAGTYNVYYRVMGDINHLDSIAAAPVAVTIAKAELTATADDKNVTYGDAVPAYTVTYEGWLGEDTITVLNGDIAFACQYAPTSNVGEYTITPSGVSAANYNITFVNGKVTVAQALLTVTAENKTVTYGDAVPAYTATYSGWKNSDDASVVSGLAYTCEYAPTSNVGEYTITPSGATATNYTFAYVNGKLTVNQAALMITAEDKEVIYGDPVPTYTATYSGWKNSDNASVVSGLVYACEYAPTSNVGEYTITPSGATATNYAISYTNGKVTVGKADLMITADDKNVIYGDAVPTYTATYSGWKNSDDASVVSGLVYACEYAPTSNVGEYTITPSGATATNYAISFTNGKVTVGKAALMITAEDKEVIYGDEAPEFTVTYSGWKNSDDASVVSDLAYTTQYMPGSSVGTYTINPNSATAQNYAITFVDGELTVVKAVISVSGAEAQIAKFEDGDTDAVVLNNGTLNGIKLNDDIDIATTAAFSDAATGENKTITLSYELIGDASLFKNYDLQPTSEIFTTDAVIIEQMITDESAAMEEEAENKEGFEVYAYGYCNGNSYSIRYHLESGNPDQYKIAFDNSRFDDVDWTDLTVAGKEGTIDIDIPEDLPTGDYRMTITFRDSRFTWLESDPITVSFHVNLPKAYTAVLFDNVISLVNTCNCLTDIQWYHRDSSDDIWQAIDGANGYYYRQLGGLTGEYFVSVKMNEVATYTCPQTDMETLYGDGGKIVRVNVVPNPVVDNATVTIQGSDKLTHSLSIINLMGAEMEYRTFEGDATTVEMGEYISGNYMISVDGVAVKVIKK